MRNVEASAWENLFVMTLSALPPACRHEIQGRTGKRKRKLEGVGLLSWGSRNRIFKMDAEMNVGSNLNWKGIKNGEER